MPKHSCIKNTKHMLSKCFVSVAFGGTEANTFVISRYKAKLALECAL